MLVGSSNCTMGLTTTTCWWVFCFQLCTAIRTYDGVETEQLVLVSRQNSFWIYVEVSLTPKALNGTKGRPLKTPMQWK